MENNIEEWFTSRDFMKESGLHEVTISQFLFSLIRDKKYAEIIDGMFDQFIMDYLEDATNKEEISIDMTIMLMEIESIMEFMKNKFIGFARLDASILEKNVLDTLVSMLCKPSIFFDLYRG